MLPICFPSKADVSTQRGAAAVELAIVIIVMLFIVAGIIEFGRAFWYADALTKATRDGARLMSTWDVADIANGVTKAQNLVSAGANDAKVSPSPNVVVECDYSPPASLTPSFIPSYVTCSSGTKPTIVKVRIDGFEVNVGAWVPFIKIYGSNFGNIPLAPNTTMRYMK